MKDSRCRGHAAQAPSARLLGALFDTNPSHRCRSAHPAKVRRRPGDRLGARTRARAQAPVQSPDEDRSEYARAATPHPHWRPAGGIAIIPAKSYSSEPYAKVGRCLFATAFRGHRGAVKKIGPMLADACVHCPDSSRALYRCGLDRYRRCRGVHPKRSTQAPRRRSSTERAGSTLMRDD